MMHREGEVAIVTGACRGIDRAVTGRLGCDGTARSTSRLCSSRRRKPRDPACDGGRVTTLRDHN